MTFLPIVERELRVRARSNATYWTRFAVALAGGVICLQSMGSTPLSLQSSIGRFVFDGIVGAAFLLSCGACLLTADAISVERREGTLGLLFLTRVKAFDVLVGKLGAVGLTSLCALGAFLPVLMVPILAGGLTAGEALRKGLGLMDSLFFALAVGLCASSAQKERFKASRTAVLVVALATLLPLLPYAVARNSLQRSLGLLSPVVLLISAGERAFLRDPNAFWTSFSAVQLAAWLLVCGTALRLRRIVGEFGGALRVQTQRRSDDADPLVGLSRWHPDKEDASPIEWLVYRQQGMKAGLWGLAVLALSFSAWMSLGSARPSGLGATWWLLSWPLETALALFGGAVVAWVSSRFFLSVRRSGELEVLLTTPVGAQAIASDQWRVLKRFFGWPLLSVQAAFLVPLLAVVGRVDNLGAQLPFAILLSFANSWFGVKALCWAGMWFGLTARSQAAAILWTAGVAKGIPSLITLGCSIAAGALVSLQNRGSVEAVAAATWFPQILIFLFYTALIRLAQLSVPEVLQDGGNQRPNWRMLFRPTIPNPIGGLIIAGPPRTEGTRAE